MEDPDPRATGDGGVGALDAGLGDGSTGNPFSEAAADDRRGAGASCLNFIDDDHNGLTDCEDPSCNDPSVNRACCVGSAAAACCNATTTRSVASGACSPACLATDGTPLTPRLGQVFDARVLPEQCGVLPRTHGFAPIGDATSHGLLALPESYPLGAARLVVEGRLGVASSGELAAAGFGAFPEQGLGAIPRPLIAVLASASANEVRVIVGDRVVYAEPLADTECGRSQRYRLTLEPTGAFVVEAHGPDASGDAWRVVTRGGFDVAPTARVAMFGQQPNPGARPLAWVSDLTVAQHGCDILAPARPSSPMVSAGAAHDVNGLAIFEDDAGGLDALVTSGNQLYWMDVRRDSGTLVSDVPGSPFARIVQPVTWGPDFARVEDVDVVVVADVRRAFLAAGPIDGPLSIYATTWDARTRSFPSEAPTRVLAPSEFDTDTRDAISIDGPSALVRGGRLVLAVRVQYADGGTELRIRQVSDTLDASLAPEGVVALDSAGVTTNGLLHVNRSSSPTAFDRDEIADPQLVEIDGIVRVLYAGRRGTRWSLGMVVASPDFAYFTPVGTEPVLAPSGVGFDALGVSEPFLVRTSGEDRLYYAGSDGSRRSIGLARQPSVRP
jgi:hypothetical protein